MDDDWEIEKNGIPVIEAPFYMLNATLTWSGQGQTVLFRFEARPELDGLEVIPIPPSKHELRSHFEPLDLRWSSSQ